MANPDPSETPPQTRIISDSAAIPTFKAIRLMSGTILTPETKVHIPTSGASDQNLLSDDNSLMRDALISAMVLIPGWGVGKVLTGVLDGEGSPSVAWM